MKSDDLIKAEVLDIQDYLEQLADGEQEFIKRIRKDIERGVLLSEKAIQRVENIWQRVVSKVVKFA